MITAIVQFKLPNPVSRDKAQQLFLGTAPKYREAAGLVRKYYLICDVQRYGRISGAFNPAVNQADCRNAV
jgi:hypothetical protein